ncbi:LacI family DNA-binding transcriptional regulator [Enterococcus casseliflavus]|uniref:LacI family DNA-binding transcriptional regulator n=1 Tax=Enterococcus casseliflavus TaxID=37734 RepID=UPI003D1297B3
MTTLADVAKKANVSAMTVSRVINHPDKVTEELKQLVHQAMLELDYQPNIAAKSLVSKRSHIIKVYILEEMDTTEPYYMNLLVGIARSIGKAHYSLQLVTTDGVDRGPADGCIITGFRQKDMDWIKNLKKPVVLFGENEAGFSFVDSDNYQGIVSACKHALDTGYQHLVYIGLELEEAFTKSREKGYIDTVTKTGQAPKIHRFENRSSAARTFITARKEQFAENTCFICATDRLALGINQGLQSIGAQIPKDFGIVGYDGVFLDQVSSPKLTTMKQAIVEMGEACGELLIQKIEQNDTSQRQQRFLPQLVVRESTR